MSDDNNGIVDDPRSGQQQEAREDAQGVKEAYGQQHQVSENSCGSDEPEIDKEAIVEKFSKLFPRKRSSAF